MNIISTEGDMYLNSDSIDSSKRSVWEICERKIIHEVRRVQYLSISFTQRARKITYQYLLYAHPYPPLPKPLSLSNLSHPSVTCCDTPEPLRKLSEILNLVFKSGEGWWWGGLRGIRGPCCHPYSCPIMHWDVQSQNRYPRFPAHTDRIWWQAGI